MKQLLAIIGFTLVMTSASASQIKICAIEATEVCSEITIREDFQKCHSAIMASCLEDNFGGYKSVPACMQRCFQLPEGAQRESCLQTCSPL